MKKRERDPTGVTKSGQAGCLMNIGGRLRRVGSEIEVLHLAELLERR